MSKYSAFPVTNCMLTSATIQVTKHDWAKHSIYYFNCFVHNGLHMLYKFWLQLPYTVICSFHMLIINIAFITIQIGYLICCDGVEGWNWRQNDSVMSLAGILLNTTFTSFAFKIKISEIFLMLRLQTLNVWSASFFSYYSDHAKIFPGLKLNSEKLN